MFKNKNDKSNETDEKKIKDEKVKEKKVKEKKVKEKNKDGKKIKLIEKISLNFRRKWLLDNTRSFLIIILILLIYTTLNLWAMQADLPEIDITENKIYTLSDTSKKALSNITQDIKIYVYGFEEDSNIVDFLKQYNKTNNKITYEFLTEESNYDMVQKYALQEGYYVLILKSGESEKVIDSSSLTTYDNTTYQAVDITEQTITNSILALNEENKPKIYFVQGHGEFQLDELAILQSFLTNEAFEVDTINLATIEAIPDDCDILAILSPDKDFFDVEVPIVKNYINKGGEIYCSTDVVSNDTTFPNLQLILDEYGVSIQNGYIVELKAGKSRTSNPYIFIPEVSSTHKITRDIYTDSKMWLVYSGRLQFQSDETLQNLNVVKETLLNSSDESAFVTDVSKDLKTAIQEAPITSSEIAAIITKTIPTPEGEELTADDNSKLVIVASSSFISDYVAPGLTESMPLSSIESNKDFVINSMAFLGDKGNSLTIRKDYSSSTYMPTQLQNMIVMAIIIFVPVFIIIFGVMIWAYRQRRK